MSKRKLSDRAKAILALINEKSSVEDDGAFWSPSATQYGSKHWCDATKSFVYFGGGDYRVVLSLQDKGLLKRVVTQNDPTRPPYMYYSRVTEAGRLLVESMAAEFRKMVEELRDKNRRAADADR